MDIRPLTMILYDLPRNCEIFKIRVIPNKKINGLVFNHRFYFFYSPKEDAVYFSSIPRKSARCKVNKIEGVVNEHYWEAFLIYYFRQPKEGYCQKICLEMLSPDSIEEVIDRAYKILKLKNMQPFRYSMHNNMHSMPNFYSAHSTYNMHRTNSV